MRALIFVAAAAVLCGCKADRTAVADSSCKADAVALTSVHAVSEIVDSIIRDADFSFDSMRISFPVSDELTKRGVPASVTLVNGRLKSHSRRHRSAKDSSAFTHAAAATASSASSASERKSSAPAYPLSGAAAALAVAAGFAALFLWSVLCKRK